MGAFFGSLKIQCRVVGALMMREIYTRYGRENLGFAWVFAEPLMFVFPVLTMWHFIRPRYAPGNLVYADISWSGYLPLMLYRHLGGLAMGVVRINAPLLYHRVISIYDVLAARILVEAISNYATALFSMFVLVLVGEMQPPLDWPMLFVGYFFMTWWCAAIAIIVAGLSERSVWVEKIWMPVGYMYIAVSGCFFLADWLSPRTRSIALVQPSLQAYEMIRCGVFGNEVKTYYDIGYDTFILSVMTIIGLAALRAARRYVMLA